MVVADTGGIVDGDYVQCRERPARSLTACALLVPLPFVPLFCVFSQLTDEGESRRIFCTAFSLSFCSDLRMPPKKRTPVGAPARSQSVPTPPNGDGVKGGDCTGRTIGYAAKSATDDHGTVSHSPDSTTGSSALNRSGGHRRECSCS